MRVEDSPSTTATRPGATSSRRPLSQLLMGLVFGVLATTMLGIFVVGPLIIAKRNDLPLERAYGDVAVGIASRIFAPNQPSPTAQNPRAVSVGRDAYTGSCAVCHGATGDGRGLFGVSSYPNATDLTSRDAAEKSDAQTFWIIKNGLSFTGMPGFADQYSDQDIWSLVTYLRALQNPSSAASGGNRVQFGPIDVPTPTPDQLDRADAMSSDPVARGAAIYFAQACQTCHGAVGDAPGNLSLGRGGGPQVVRAVRDGRSGMPAYNQVLISDSELSDLQAYLSTIGGTRRGESEGEGGDRAPAGPGRPAAPGG